MVSANQPPPDAAGASGDDASKKVRKPFDRDWKKIEAFVGSKTVSRFIFHAEELRHDAVASSWTHNSIPPILVSSMVKEDLGAGAMGPNNFCSSSTEGPARVWQPGETNDQMNHLCQILHKYTASWAVFLIQAQGTLEKLKEMIQLMLRRVCPTLPGFCTLLNTIRDFGSDDSSCLQNTKAAVLADRSLSTPFMIKGE
ncbi:hypothetical protein GUJ93_ZPchr0136g33679 [Zizania palustris]|uniref:Uncharacterized protein n=1 Tax=Zizania palustris TaxID=103762 RepID=A0A8J5RE17_ZIZPA|nr:hypothetical protein GUJ93_ZPchr0136g33679 [Zizania palustris]